MKKKLRIPVLDMPMAELAEVRRVTGRTFVRITGKVNVGETTVQLSLDEELLAALVWVIRRRTEPALEFFPVFTSLTLADLADVDIDLGDPSPADK